MISSQRHSAVSLPFASVTRKDASQTGCLSFRKLCTYGHSDTVIVKEAEKHCLARIGFQLLQKCSETEFSQQ